MKRRVYKELLQWKAQKKRKPLILNGVRQVGKTYLLQEFGSKEFNRFHYVNFEEDSRMGELFSQDLNPQRILQDIEFYLNSAIDKQKDLLILDEIQACPRALTSLKYFFEKMPQLAVACAGSLLGLHLGESSFPVGKVDMIPIFPMNFTEFLVAIDDQRAINGMDTLIHRNPVPELLHEHLWNRLKQYLIVGGLPEPVRTFRDRIENTFSALSEVRRRQNSLVTAYLADMAKHAGKVNAMHLDRVWNGVVAQTAQAQDESISRFKFKGVIPGVSHYSRLVGAIDWLCSCGLLHKIHIAHAGRLPLFAFTKENQFKLILFDIGILGALADLHPKVILESNYGTYKGFVAENFVAQEFISSGFKKLYSWQENQAEIDFLTEVEGELLPIEVKSGKITRAKSLAQFSRKYQVSKRVILSGAPMQIKGGLYKLPLYLAGHLSEVLF